LGARREGAWGVGPGVAGERGRGGLGLRGQRAIGAAAGRDWIGIGAQMLRPRRPGLRRWNGGDCPFIGPSP
jgi:hypothetical protein